jgi:hypothetical protein
MVRLMVVCAVLALGCNLSAAEDVASQLPPFVVTPQGELPLREAPPGLFTGKGSQIGVVQPGADYIVIERKYVPSIFGGEEWLKVQPAGPPGAGGITSGWALGGGTASIENFEIRQSIKPVM